MRTLCRYPTSLITCWTASNAPSIILYLWQIFSRRTMKHWTVMQADWCWRW